MSTGDPHMVDDVRHAKKKHQLIIPRAKIFVGDKTTASLLIPTEIRGFPYDSADSEAWREVTTQTCMATDTAVTDTDPSGSNVQTLMVNLTDAQKKMQRSLVIHHSVTHRWDEDLISSRN